MRVSHCDLSADTTAIERTSSANLCPGFTGSVPKVCALSHVARRESRPEKQGRKEEGVAGGTRSRTQEVEKDEEAGDNVMHRGAEPEEGPTGRKSKRRARSEEAAKECWKRRTREGVCIWHWEAGKDSVGQAGRTCVFVFD